MTSASYCMLFLSPVTTQLWMGKHSLTAACYIKAVRAHSWSNRAGWDAGCDVVCCLSWVNETPRSFLSALGKNLSRAKTQANLYIFHQIHVRLFHLLLRHMKCQLKSAKEIGSWCQTANKVIFETLNKSKLAPVLGK